MLLADPRLAGDQNRDVAAQKLPELGVDLGHGGGPADNMAGRKIEFRWGGGTDSDLDVDRFRLGMQKHPEHRFEQRSGGAAVGKIANQNEAPR